MKMGPGLFWGLILIIIGLSIIFKVLFDISIFRIVIAAVLILIAIKIMIGKPIMHTDDNDNVVIFGERHYTITPIDKTEYSTVFGKTSYDLREVQNLDELHTRVEFNTVFGSTEIFLPDSIPVKIKTEAVFGTAEMPNGNSVAFGSTKYSSEDIMTDAQLLEIEANVVFGGLKIHRSQK
jgi:predicted membrane protein